MGKTITTEAEARSGMLLVSEVAAELRIPRSRAYEMVGREIPAVRVGRKSIGVRRRDLDAYIEGRPVNRADSE